MGRFVAIGEQNGEQVIEIIEAIDGLAAYISVYEARGKSYKAQGLYEIGTINHLHLILEEIKRLPITASYLDNDKK